MADFNLSRAMKGMEMVPTSGVINSPEWAAPERLSGQAYGRSSDVFRSASYQAAHACVQFGSLRSSRLRNDSRTPLTYLTGCFVSARMPMSESLR